MYGTDTLPGVEIRVDRHYEGPSGTANGGWACGLVAGLLTGPESAPGTAVEVTLRGPIPLETPVLGERREDSAFLTGLPDGNGAGRVLAQARLLGDAEAAALPPPPPFVALADAGRAGAPEACVPSPFPTCYVCGTDRRGGLRLTVGPVATDPTAGTAPAGTAPAGPVAGTALAGPVAGTATAGPVAGTATAGPVAGTATAGPVAGTATAGPVAGTATAGPVAGSGSATPAGGSGHVAGVWNPPPSTGDLQTRYLWAALDCPTGLVHIADDPVKALLGRLTMTQHRTPVPGEPLVVVAAATGVDRRKRFATAALYTPAGELVARSAAIWITV